uniref:Uncharacterized protein n=1 Tax=Anguilla anguilla TaxID=7936 RepID=A0A0E9UP50_ANGAN
MARFELITDRQCFVCMSNLAFLMLKMCFHQISCFCSVFIMSK